MSKPGNVDPSNLLYGAPCSAQSEDSFIRGSLCRVDTATGKCSVICEDGSVFHSLDWPGLNRSPHGSGCTIMPPEPGTIVEVKRSPIGVTITNVISPPPATGLKKANRAVRRGFNINPPGTIASAYRDSIPEGVVIGDRLFMGNQGQMVGVLEGGRAVVQATSFCGLEFFSENDTGRLTARNLQVMTGMGDLNFFDKDGKMGISFKGGTDKLTQVGYGNTGATVRFNMGNTSVGFMDLRFTDTSGNNLWTHEIMNNGNEKCFTAGDHTQHADGQINIFAGAGAYKFLASGDDVIDVSNGSAKRNVSGSYDLRAQQAIDLKSGSSAGISAQKDVTIQGGSKIFAAVGAGNPLGGQIVIGNYDPNVLAKVCIDTMNQIDSVLLGANFGIAQFHVVKFEPMVSFLTQLLLWLAGHTHPTGVGPSGTPLPVPFEVNSGLQPMILPMMSLKVAVGN